MTGYCLFRPFQTYQPEITVRLLLYVVLALASSNIRSMLARSFDMFTVNGAPDCALKYPPAVVSASFDAIKQLQ